MQLVPPTCATNTESKNSAKASSKAELENIRGKTVFITGGASGIGREAVVLAHGEYYFPRMEAKQGENTIF